MSELEGPAKAERLRVMVEVTVPRDAPRERIFQTARALTSAGLDLDPDYAVRLRPPHLERERLESAGQQLVLVRGTIDAARKAELDKHPDAYRVWIDTPVQPFAGAINCGGAAVGTLATTLTGLGVTRIWKRGYRGRGVQVGVVDGGLTVTGRAVSAPELPPVFAAEQVVDGWPTASWGTTALGWGPGNAQHGNMVGYDILAVAPEAQLWDIRIWQDMPNATPAEKFAVYVSNAIAGYEFAIGRFTSGGAPQILTNSWGLYNSANGPDFSDPRSPFALMVEEALDTGILVLFAAGNCGTGCLHPSTSPCGTTDRGPGKSILGPNGHPDVMTVGGADTNAVWYGFTSQGAAVLPPRAAKPDFCSLMQFTGFFPPHGPKPFDGGTSTACATAAGVVALLKDYRPALTQAQAKNALRTTARNIRAPGFDSDSGAGIIRAYTAFGTL